MRIALLSIVLAWLMASAVHGEPQEPTKKATERAEVLKKNPKAFQLRLLYHGDQDKPFYNLTLTVYKIGSWRPNQPCTESQRHSVLSL